MQKSEKASELGCSDGDDACLCRNANFAYGVRDCSAQYCNDRTTGLDAIKYVFDWCDSKFVFLMIMPGHSCRDTD